MLSLPMALSVCSQKHEWSAREEDTVHHYYCYYCYYYCYYYYCYLRTCHSN